MPAYNVVISREADKDLNDIADYIADELLSPEVAIDLIQNLEATMYKRLDTFPHAYPVHAFLESLGTEYRRTVIGNFTAFYKIQEASKDEESGTVTITYVVYNRRDVENIVIPESHK